MATRPRQRDVRFEVLDGQLVRTVTFPNGRSYEHRCSRTTYEAVAYAIDQTPAEGEGVTLETVATAHDLPYTQVNVCLEFLKERGVVTVRGRRCYPTSTVAFEDAMVELTALQHNSSG